MTRYKILVERDSETFGLFRETTQWSVTGSYVRSQLMWGGFASPDEAEARLHRYLERKKKERSFDEKGRRL